MEKRRRSRYRQPRVKPVVIICTVLAVALIAGIFIWIAYSRQLRIDMDRYLEETAEQIEIGEYEDALLDAEKALFAAYRLREYELADKADAYIRLINTISRGDRFFNEGNYEDALETYKLAEKLASDIPGLGMVLIEKKIFSTERFIAFYTLIDHAGRIVEITGYDSTELLYEEKVKLYNTVISIYDDARKIASDLSFAEGIDIAESGVSVVRELMVRAKRTEAVNIFFLGNQQFNDGDYSLAHETYHIALEMFEELGDTQNISTVKDRIEIIELWYMDTDEDSTSGDETQDNTGDGIDITTNYEFNLSLDFNLTTIIDNQNQSPANQIRMGSRDGRNEGWYNGCGWVATYNALLLLDISKHPAEIVKYFEESGGTVLDGVYGTYPNVIEEYIGNFGFNVNRTTFPQLTMNIDDAIKNSRVSILSYAHTTAGHYVTIEYREDIDKFIVYNDSFARTRSANLGFSGLTDKGAAIDSVAAFINQTREILFSFSLITVK